MNKKSGPGKSDNPAQKNAPKIASPKASKPAPHTLIYEKWERKIKPKPADIPAVHCPTMPNVFPKADETQQICRFCFAENRYCSKLYKSPDDKKCIISSNMRIAMIQVVMPTFDFSLTKYPLVCDSCLSKINGFYKFFNQTMNLQEAILEFMERSDTFNSEDPEVNLKELGRWIKPRSDTLFPLTRERMEYLKQNNIKHKKGTLPTASKVHYLPNSYNDPKPNRGMLQSEPSYSNNKPITKDDASDKYSKRQKLTQNAHDQDIVYINDDGEIVDKDSQIIEPDEQIVVEDEEIIDEPCLIDIEDMKNVIFVENENLVNEKTDPPDFEMNPTEDVFFSESSNQSEKTNDNFEVKEEIVISDAEVSDSSEFS